MAPKGYGYKLWKFSMDANYGEHNVGLDGVWPQVPNYEKWGFKTCYANARYAGQRSLL